jgi:hypothetical protein
LGRIGVQREERWRPAWAHGFDGMDFFALANDENATGYLLRTSRELVRLLI